MRNRGFTLIELMVVVAVISLLAVTLVPQVSKMVERARVSRTVAELTVIGNATNIYLADVGSYPPTIPDWGRPWGADVGLVDRGSVIPAHLAQWNGPYLKDWPQRTAWGGVVGCGATGAYYIHYPIGWINRDWIADNDYWIHMNPYCARYPPQMAIEIDKVMDDGQAGSGNMRLGGGWPEYVYSYVGEGARSW